MYLRPYLAAGAGLVARSAHACVTCDSQTAHAVRSGIFNGSFGIVLLLTVAPFPVFAIIALAVYKHFPVGEVELR
jgi:hypothetical protein